MRYPFAKDDIIKEMQMIGGKGNQHTAQCSSQDKSKVTADRHSQSFGELRDEGRHVKTPSHCPSGTEPGTIA
jgi:hypothetical protein